MQDDAVCKGERGIFEYPRGLVWRSLSSYNESLPSCLANRYCGMVDYLISQGEYLIPSRFVWVE